VTLSQNMLQGHCNNIVVFYFYASAGYYGTSTLLAMQTAVLPRGISFVCLSITLW